MNYKHFPDEYEKQKREEQENSRQELKKFVDDKEYCLNRELIKINDEYADKIETTKSSFLKSDISDGRFGSYLKCLAVYKYKKFGLIMSLITVVALFVLCFLIDPNSLSDLDLEYLLGFIGASFMIWFVARPLYAYPVGIILAPILYPIYKGVCKSIYNEDYAREQSYKFEANRLKEEHRIQIHKEIAAKEDQINKHIAMLDREIMKYTNDFEAEAQQESVNYANSSLAKEVIEWLTSAYLKTIKSVNRASHIEKIIVPFDFKVYKDRIACNTGTYDFESHRCAELRSAIAQTALARAVASQIQLNVIMRYDKDSSGTSYSIDIKYEYETNSKETYYDRHSYCDPATHCRMTYNAPNGNYKSVQDW